METTTYSRRDACRMMCKLLEPARRGIQSGLREWRCGWNVRWFMVYEFTKWIRDAALELASEAVYEVQQLNRELQCTQPDANLHFKVPRKPRFARKKAPPRPDWLEWSDVEALLEAMLHWLDAVVEAADAPEGACYPHMPEPMQDVLRRNGFDPHNHRAPARMIREYLWW